MLRMAWCRSSGRHIRRRHEEERDAVVEGSTQDVDSEKLASATTAAAWRRTSLSGMLHVTHPDSGLAEVTLCHLVGHVGAHPAVHAANTFAGHRRETRWCKNSTQISDVQEITPRN